MDYADFLQRKAQSDTYAGFAPLWTPGFLFDFQASLVDWALAKGRAAIFADCVAGDTIIRSPDGDERIDVLAKQRRAPRVWAMVNNCPAIAEASPPWVNGYGPLFKIRMLSGREITTSFHHRLLTAEGWKSVSSLVIGERLVVSALSRPRSNSEHLSKKVEGFQSCYLDDHHFCDERLPSDRDNVQRQSPWPADARQHDLASWRVGDLEREPLRILSRDIARLSRPSCGLLAGSRPAAAGCKLPSSAASPDRVSIHSGQRSPAGNNLAQPSRELLPSEDGSSWGGLSWPSVGILYDILVAIDYIMDGLYYDIAVPGPANYLANDGLWSHNCGLGKGPMQLVWAENVVRKTNQPVLVMTPLAVAQQTLREAEKFGIEAHRSRGRLNGSGATVVVTNYEQLHHFDPADFGGAVCDECFPAGTRIATPFGQKDIETLQSGDMILNAYGVDRIVATKRRAVSGAVRITMRDGRQHVSSPNHPYFTRRGWVPARLVREADRLLETAEAVRMVWSGVRANKGAGRETTILRSILLSEMADATAGVSSEGAHFRSCGQAGTRASGMVPLWQSEGRGGARADTRPQSDVGPRCSCKAVAHAALDRPQSCGQAWQWPPDDRSTGEAPGGSGRWLVSRICSLVETQADGLSDLLQGRSGQSELVDRDRVRRPFSQKPESARHQERREARDARVARVEVLELGHPDLDQWRDASGQLYFYDLQAERHPSFTVDGWLVHNSSILKNFDGVRRQQVTEFLRRLPYRLLCTATAAPNDYIELGTSSEALGELGHVDMLNRFFKNDRNTTDTKARVHGNAVGWRLKGHAEHAFWRWVCSWARALRKPSDLGFDDDRFDLPPLVEREHVVEARTTADGMLFALPASNMPEEREERRRTIRERCEQVADLVSGHDRSVIWCHLNAEGDLLERLIPGAKQIAGSTPDDEKEAIYEAFSSGDLPRVITKPKIGAWGLNWYHCAHVATFASHSYEQYYQAVRRCWRFGQEREVVVDIVCSEGETRVKENLQRKSAQADRMFTNLVAEMNNAMKIVRGVLHDTELEVPAWLGR